VYIIAIYRAPTGNVNHSINRLDTVLKKLYAPSSQSIICDDTNINYLIDSEKKNQWDALLLSYNLSSTVDFPTRVQNNSATTNNDIFIEINRMNNYTVSPLFNDMSDYDSQLLTFNTIKLQSHKQFQVTRNISKHTIADFLIKLSYETWDITFTSNDNILFNSFLNTHLKDFLFQFAPEKIEKNNKK
jgi:hypothetical protein